MERIVEIYRAWCMKQKRLELKGKASGDVAPVSGAPTRLASRFRTPLSRCRASRIACHGSHPYG